jgi:hypothetical protein
LISRDLRNQQLGKITSDDFESGASASSTTPARVAETRRLLAPRSDQIECIACE